MKFGTRNIILFPFLQCNQHCKYCINHFGDSVETTNLKYKLAPGSSWITAVNNLEDVEDVQFIGGEPTLHPDFSDILNALRPLKKLLIGTNGSTLALEALLRTAPRHDLWVQISYHPTETGFEPFVERLKAIRSVHPNIGVHTITKDGVTNPAIKEMFRAHGFNIGFMSFIHDETGYLPRYAASFSSRLFKRTIECDLSIYRPVAPNGNVYACHQLMYDQSQVGIIGNIFEGWMSRCHTVRCPMFGHCNPCDAHHFIKSYSLTDLYRREPRLDPLYEHR